MLCHTARGWRKKGITWRSPKQKAAAAGLGFILLYAAGTALAAGEFPYTSDDYLTCFPDRPQRPSIKVMCDALHHAPPWDGHTENPITNAISFWGHTQGNYERLLRDLPMGSVAQQRVIAEQKAFLDRRDRCGKNIVCIGDVEQARNEELMAQRRKVEQPFPVEEMQRLTRAWKTPEGRPLYQRLLAGLAIYPLRQATLDNGYQLQWGFQPHQATVQTLGVLDPQGKIAALVTADDVYRAWRSEGGTYSGRLRIYVRSAGELGKLLPVIYSWTLADLLGFNLDCKGKDAELCSQAKQASRPPMEAYDLGCKHPNRPSCRLPVIEHPPVAVPLGGC